MSIIGVCAAVVAFRGPMAASCGVVSVVVSLHQGAPVAMGARAAALNVVLILADDLGNSDVGFNGNSKVAEQDPQLAVSTPTLDALAATGTILRQHYSCHVCTPTRAALMTGRYPSRYGAQHRTFSAPRPQGVNLNETLLSEQLQSYGYKTYLVGKWHLGFPSPAFTPLQRGFDSTSGLTTVWMGAPFTY